MVILNGSVLLGGKTQSRWLEDELKAFVGTSYVDLNQIRWIESEFFTPSTEETVSPARAYTYRFKVDVRHQDAVLCAMQRMQLLWRQRPPRASLKFKGLPQLLKDFELAVAIGDAKVARQRFDELKESGRFGAD